MPAVKEPIIRLDGKRSDGTTLLLRLSISGLGQSPADSSRLNLDGVREDVTVS